MDLTWFLTKEHHKQRFGTHLFWNMFGYVVGRYISEYGWLIALFLSLDSSPPVDGDVEEAGVFGSISCGCRDAARAPSWGWCRCIVSAIRGVTGLLQGDPQALGESAIQREGHNFLQGASACARRRERALASQVAQIEQRASGIYPCKVQLGESKG